MSQPMQPSSDPMPPDPRQSGQPVQPTVDRPIGPASAMNEAYRRGYMAGHLAGWRDAVAKYDAGTSVSLPEDTAVKTAVQAVALGSEVAAQPEGFHRPPAVGEIPLPARTHVDPQFASSQTWAQSAVQVPTVPTVPAMPAMPTVPQAPAPSQNVGRAVPMQQPTILQAGRPTVPAQPQLTGSRAPGLGMPHVAQPKQGAPTHLGPRAVLVGGAGRNQSPEQLAAWKIKREAQNINITLYIACLLMVAAAALFIGSTAPAGVRLLGVWAAVVIFYGAGMVLHQSVQRLRPAAIAFTGTALAIIPFAGIATYSLGFKHAAAAWLVTSVLGTFAYIIAALKFNSRLLVYLSLAFVLSTAWSSVAILGAALAWYFTSLIIISAIIMVLARSLARRATVAEAKVSIYEKPLEVLGPWFAPAGIIASLLLFFSLNAADHALVLVAGAIYYGVLFVIDAPKRRAIDFMGLHVSVALAAPFLGWLIGGTPAWAAGATTIVLAVSTLTVCYLRGRLDAHLGGPWAKLDVYISVPVVAFVSLIWAISLRWEAHTSAEFDLSPAVPLALALVVALLALPALGITGEATLAIPLVFALVPGLLHAQDWSILLAVALLCSGVLAARAQQIWLRRAHIVAARLLGAGLVSALLTAYIPAHSGKTVVILTIIAAIAAGQLLVDTFMGKFAAANPVTAWSGVAWAVIGTGLVVSLSTLNFTAVALSTGGATMKSEGAFVIAAVVMGIATMLHSILNVSHEKKLVPAEAMAPSYLVVAALAVPAVLGSAGTLTAWTVNVLYLVSMGLRLRGAQSMNHRWLYWFAAMVAALAVPVALHALLSEHHALWRLGAGQISLPQMVVGVLLIEAVILSVAVWRLRGPRAAEYVLAAMVSLASLMVTFAAVANIFTSGGGLPALLTASLAAAVIGLALVVAVRKRDNSSAPSVFWAGCTALVLLALGQAADRRSLELVLTIVLVVASAAWLRASSPSLAGASLILARLSSVFLVAVVASEFTSNSGIISFALSISVFSQLGLQWLLLKTRGAGSLGSRIQLSASLWTLLVLQGSIPLFYLAITSFGGPTPSDRWRIVIELVLLAIAALVVQGVFRQRGTSYLAIVSVMGVAAVIAPVTAPGAVTVVLALASLAVIAWRMAKPPVNLEMQWFWLVAVVGFLLAALWFDQMAPAAVQSLSWLVTGLCVIVGGLVQRSQWMVIPGALMVWLGASRATAQGLESFDSAGLAYLIGWAVLVLVLGGFLWLARKQLAGQDLARYSITAIAVLGGLIFAVIASSDPKVSLLAAAAATATLALACLSLPQRFRSLAIDMSVVLAALIWFWACTVCFDLGGYWFLQWLAVAAGGIAAKRYVQKQPQAGRILLIVAASLISVGALVTLIDGDAIQQLVTLVLFVALLAVGMLVDERLFTIWGAVGVASAVIWYLRGYTYILLAILALSLIGFVIWRLTRKKTNDAGTLPSTSPNQPVWSGPQLPHQQAQYQQSQYQQQQFQQSQYQSAQPQAMQPHHMQSHPMQPQAFAPQAGQQNLAEQNHPVQKKAAQKEASQAEDGQAQGPVAPPS